MELLPVNGRWGYVLRGNWGSWGARECMGAPPSPPKNVTSPALWMGDDPTEALPEPRSESNEDEGRFGSAESTDKRVEGGRDSRRLQVA